MPMKTERNGKMVFAEKRVDLEISDISYGWLDSSWDLNNVRSSFTRIYFPIEGEGLLTVGDEQIRLCPDNIYIVPSGLCFSGRCDSFLNKIFVHLTLTAPDGADIFCGIDRCIVLHGQGDLIKKAIRLYSDGSILSVLEFKLMLYHILITALGDEKELTADLKNYSETTLCAIDYVNEHLCASLTVDEIACALFVPKSSLQRRFKDETGRSLGRYIDGCLSLRAEGELLDPTLSIGEISERLGFCDQFYFSRKFKKTHGVSPRVFRQKHNIQVRSL